MSTGCVSVTDMSSTFASKTRTHGTAVVFAAVAGMAFTAHAGADTVGFITHSKRS